MRTNLLRSHYFVCKGELSGNFWKIREISGNRADKTNPARAPKCVRGAKKNTARRFGFPRGLFSGNFGKILEFSGIFGEIQELSGNVGKRAQENLDCGNCVHGNATDLFSMWTQVLRHVQECEVYRTIRNTFQKNATSREDMEFRAAEREETAM